MPVGTRVAGAGARSRPSLRRSRHAAAAGPLQSSQVSALLMLQRTAGNRAVAQLLGDAAVQRRRAQVPAAGTHQRQATAAGHPGGVIVVQRAAQHFWNYLNSKVSPLDATKQNDKEALITAWLLDQNVYELEALLKSAYQHPNLQNEHLLQRKGLSLGDVVAFLHARGAPQPNAEGHMAWLNLFVNQMPRHLTTVIGQFAQTATGKHASIIQWQGLTGWGAGTGVSLHMLPGGIPAGSPAGGDPVWMKQVEQHHPSSGSTTLYVRGHLLNYDIGGPGLDYNMVPITGKPSKNVGGNDANGEHYSKVEADAKKVWDSVRLGTYTEGIYEVKPNYPRPGRAETGQVRAQATLMRQILDSQVATIRTGLALLPGPQIETQYRNALATHSVPVPQPLPSRSDQIETLTRIQAHQLENQSLAQLRSVNNPVAQAIDTQLHAGILQASAGGAPGGKTVRDLLALVAGNAATWEAEDTYIPSSLDIRLEWQEAGTGNKGSKAVPPIPVTLSTDVANVWFRPKKSSELA